MISLIRHFYHYLLLTLTGSLILGIIVAENIPLFASYLFELTIIALIFTGVAFFITSKVVLTIVLVLTFSLFGIIHGLLQTPAAPTADDVSRRIEGTPEALLIGTLAKMKRWREASDQIVLDSYQFRAKEDGFFTPVTGKVLVTIKGHLSPSILPGDDLIIRATFRKPVGRRTEGQFDYSRYLADRDIFLTATVRSPLLIHPVTVNQDRSVQKQLNYFIERLRSHLSAFLFTNLSPYDAALYQALLIGDKSRVPQETIDTFKRTGVMHILAISGLHMGLLGFFLFSTLLFCTRQSRWLLLNTDIRKLSLFICIFPLLIYSLLAGSNTPVVRSFLMSLLFILAYCFNRPKSHLTLISAAALIIVIVSPRSIFSPSFQLSFFAVISIIGFTPIFLRLFPGYNMVSGRKGVGNLILKRVIELTVISISAILGTSPLLLHHFNQISTVGLLANLIVEPLICLWALPFGFSGIAFHFVSQDISALALSLGSIAFNIVTPTLDFLSSWQNSALWLPAPPLWLTLIYYLCLMLLISDVSRTIKIRTIWPLALTCLCALVYLSGALNRVRDSTSISFIDVGQGSSTLLMLRGGKNVLIDSGASTAPGFDCGRSIVAPYLWSQGIRRLDDIIVTHADADHYNGVPSLLERFRPTRLWLPLKGSPNSGYQNLIATAKKHKMKITYLQSPQQVKHRTYTLNIIPAAFYHYPQHSHQSPLAGTNDHGLLVSLESSGFSLLIPGDISAQMERVIVETATDIQHDLLVSPHHGSASSNTRSFLEAVSPSYLIVSSGESAYGTFPSIQTIETADRLGIDMLVTAQDGTIEFTDTE